jgi:hypothetical protein
MYYYLLIVLSLYFTFLVVMGNKVHKDVEMRKVEYYR